MTDDRATTLEVLREGSIEILGRIMGSTNNALYVRVTRPCAEPVPAQVVDAVYKPTIGERPLDDFPDGTLQAFVEVDDEVDVVQLVLTDDRRLRRMATFDAVVNNTDRKGGHILPI